MRRFISILGCTLVLSCCPALVAALLPSQIVAQLSSPAVGLSSQAQIYAATNPNFVNETTQRYTTHDAPTYVVSVKPAVDSDVQKIVLYAVINRVPFLATGGGHGFTTTFGGLQNGIEIDLSLFDSVAVDAANNRLTIGGAVRFRDIIQPLYDAGKEIQTGSQSCVGMVGATLGGGVGRYSGLHGMIIDALVSVELVVASGSIVTASATQNADLFWAVRGAGFNFGIVLSATYQVYDLTATEVMNADFLFLPNASTELFDFFQSYQLVTPAKLSLILESGYEDELGGGYIVVNAVYAGSLDAGTALIQPLIDASSVMKNISMVPWNELLGASFFGAEPLYGPCPVNELRNVYGGAIYTYDIPTFQDFYTNLTNLWEEYPDTRLTNFFIEHFATQAIEAVPDSATAYPWRDITAHLLFNYGYTNPELDAVVDAFAQQTRSAFDATSGFDDSRVYVSYAHGDESLQAIYGPTKLPELQALKLLWDPENIFGYMVSLL